jgi:hypothetical protein
MGIQCKESRLKIDAVLVMLALRLFVKHSTSITTVLQFQMN